ncbi:MAG: glycerate kinase [Arachnia sp.]
MATVVFAPDSFKGTLRASDAARALAEGWRAVRPYDELVPIPMADGGEGTLDAFELANAGSRRMPVTVTGPDGRPIAAHWLLLPDGTGVVELACTSGIELLTDGPRPLTAHTLGFGQAVRAAVEHGVGRLILGIGSSASTDGGAGMLRALGADLRDAEGAPISDGARGLAHLARADLAGVLTLPETLVLSDVTNPLLGPRGAAAVFGPQKGLDEKGIAVAEEGLARLARALGADPGQPGAGAAGGTGFALLALGATLVPGSERLGALLGLPEALSRADAVVTGEGRFDDQSLSGKVPGYVLGLAGDGPVSLVAGIIAADADTRQFAAALSLTELAGSAETATREPGRWLTEAGRRLAAAMRT